MSEESNDIKIISPRSGAAFSIKKGDFLKVIDPKGEQVSDMVVYNDSDIGEKLSSGKTIDFEETIYLSKGHKLWSNRSNVMMEIIEDTSMCNDFLLAPCSLETFKFFYGQDEYSPSCFENLHTNLAKYGVTPDDVPTAFNIFMNVVVDEKGKVSVKPPKSKAGDYVLFRASMDLIVGLTACSAGASNNYSFKEIHYEIIASSEND